MDSYNQSRLRAQGPAFARARPRSRFSDRDSTLSTISVDTTSTLSTVSNSWTESEDEFRLPSPPLPPPVNPFFRGPRPAPQDVFRFGRRRGKSFSLVVCVFVLED